MEIILEIITPGLLGRFKIIVIYKLAAFPRAVISTSN
jgi:hypothetical protein